MRTARTTVTWRKRGLTKPADVVLVARPSRWGNPFTIAEHGQLGAVDAFRAWVAKPDQADYRQRARRDLKGKRLACYCQPCLPCHADVLVEVADTARPAGK